MAVYKADHGGRITWDVKIRYNDWTGERKQKKKGRLCHQARGSGVGDKFPQQLQGQCYNDLRQSYREISEGL